MSELFKIEECKSPRLLWLEKHKVQHSHLPHEEKGYEFMAWMGDKPSAMHFSGYGSTLQEALCNMAKLNGIPLWNEEGFANQSNKNQDS